MNAVCLQNQPVGVQTATTGHKTSKHTNNAF